MSNMSYCRFENTLQDLRDCECHLDEAGLSENEQSARISLVLTCIRIAEMFEDMSEDEVRDDLDNSNSRGGHDEEDPEDN